MTADPLAFLRAAHTTAEAEAEAARNEAGDADWYAGDEALHAHNAGQTIVNGPWGHLDETLGAYLARHDPAAVLRRITAERKILAKHHELGIDGQCARCVDWSDDEEGDLVADPEPYPCDTIRLLAEGWGWTPAT